MGVAVWLSSDSLSSLLRNQFMFWFGVLKNEKQERPKMCVGSNQINRTPNFFKHLFLFFLLIIRTVFIVTFSKIQTSFPPSTTPNKNNWIGTLRGSQWSTFLNEFYYHFHCFKLLDIDLEIPLTCCISCVSGITGYSPVS